MFASLTDSGPWTQVLEFVLDDSLKQQDPLPVQLIRLNKEATARFVKFNVVDWWGDGGGLQYFDIQRIRTTTPRAITPSTMTSSK